MKSKYIITILLIAISIIIVISMAGDASTYVTFQEAKNLNEKGLKKSIHVIGSLPKSVDGAVLGIKEGGDKLTFSFEMIDEQGFKQKVLHLNPIPVDFIRSEQVVIVGKYHGESFIADKILLKCPSKYQDTTLSPST